MDETPSRATWVLPLVSAVPQALILLLLVGIGYDVAGREPGLLVKIVVGAMLGPPVLIAHSNYRRRQRALELAEMREHVAQLSGSYAKIKALTGEHRTLALQEVGDERDR